MKKIDVENLKRVGNELEERRTFLKTAAGTVAGAAMGMSIITELQAVEAISLTTPENNPYATKDNPYATKNNPPTIN